MAGGRMWLVRAGEGGAFVGEFLAGSHVAIGWREAGLVTASTTDAELQAAFDHAYPDEKPGSRRVWLAIVRRFVREVAKGDSVMTYDPEKRVYYLGEIESDVEARNHELSRARRVKWTQEVARDALLLATRNSLGSIATLFQVSGDALDDVRANTKPLGSPAPVEPAKPEPVEPTGTVLGDTLQKADELVQDRIVALAWDEVQELVAGILRAMGYRARVARPGSDRGVDIFASRDGLGLEEPRIFVEVKHRKGKIDAPAVRSFLGGRKPGDRCVYVSTGGFTKEALYEADRASVPLQLVDLERLRELLLEHYERLAPDVQAMVPLKRLYWPID